MNNVKFSYGNWRYDDSQTQATHKHKLSTWKKYTTLNNTRQQQNNCLCCLILYPAPPEFTSMPDTCYLRRTVLSLPVRLRYVPNQRATLDCSSQHTRNHKLLTRNTQATHTTTKTGTVLKLTGAEETWELNAVPTFVTRWNLHPNGHRVRVLRRMRVKFHLLQLAQVT